MKRIVLLYPDGTETPLHSVPTLTEMQTMLGGYVEHVRVLDRIEDHQWVYTSMYVNETGLLDGLPRNAKATAIYQRNVRLAYHGSAAPFAEARTDWLARLDPRVHVIDGTAKLHAGYRDDPYIAGSAIVFEGYTVEEANRALDADEEEDHAD